MKDEVKRVRVWKTSGSVLPLLHVVRHFGPCKFVLSCPGASAYRPFLERQSYVLEVLDRADGAADLVGLGRPGMSVADAAALAFGAPPCAGPWLECDEPLVVGDVVINHHRDRHREGDRMWRSVMQYPNKVFVGAEEDWRDFVNRFGPVRFHQVADWWEAARVVKGAQLVCCDQGEVYWLAAGLGVTTLLEREHNDPGCRTGLPNVTYFDPLSGEGLLLPRVVASAPVHREGPPFRLVAGRIKVSCLLVSHAKPDYCHYAIDSVLAQEYQDWELVVMDSGDLHGRGYFGRWNDPRIKINTTGETAQTRREKAMAPWCFNECWRRGLVSGDLVTYLCDDDLLYPNAFRTFAEWSRGGEQACYAAIDLSFFRAGGPPAIYRELRPVGLGGVGGCRLNCRVDSLQLCHRSGLLGRVSWPEGLDTCRHADGVFVDLLGSVCPIHPLDVKVGQNRRTPLSTYTPHGA